jgi:hypothetical protein
MPEEALVARLEQLAHRIGGTDERAPMSST